MVVLINAALQKRDDLVQLGTLEDELRLRLAAQAAGAGRVAIVDFDVHHGNGTQDIFWDDDSVLFVSLHQWPFYPGTGGPQEQRDTTLNVRFGGTSDDMAYGVAVDGRSGGSAPSGQVQLSRLVISPRAFAAARSGTTVRTAAHATGARVSYKLSGPASVHFTVARPVAGRRGRGGRCVAPTRTNRRARRCTRLARVGRFTVSGHAGQNRLRFTGRVAGRALKRAAYRLTATPVAAGRSGRGATVAFRITG